MKKPRQSRLSQTTRIKHLEEENKNYQDFIDDLMTLLEDYGFLEPEEDDCNLLEPADLEEEPETEEPEVILVLPPAEQDESQHPKHHNPSDEP